VALRRAVLANHRTCARFTVFLETPNTRATSEIDNPSARHNRHDLRPILHTQHPLPPRLDSSQGLGEAAQFSVAAQWSVLGCRRQRVAAPGRRSPRVQRQIRALRGRRVRCAPIGSWHGVVRGWGSPARSHE
jgi:hypothetical protein